MKVLLIKIYSNTYYDMYDDYCQKINTIIPEGVWEEVDVKTFNKLKHAVEIANTKTYDFKYYIIEKITEYQPLYESLEKFIIEQENKEKKAEAARKKRLEEDEEKKKARKLKQLEKLKKELGEV